MRRMVELAVEAAGPPPTEFAWLSLGSQGRREAVPSSDVDFGMVWDDGGGRRRRDVHDGYRQAGRRAAGRHRLESDAHGVTASGPAMAWAAAEWREAIGRWLDRADRREPDGDLDPARRPHDRRAGATHSGCSPPCGTREPTPGFVRLLLRLALASRPPTGFLHDIVVEDSGEHAGKLQRQAGGSAADRRDRALRGPRRRRHVHVDGRAAASGGRRRGAAQGGRRHARGGVST